MHADSQHVRAALDAGASGYVVKGAGVEALVSALRAVAAGQHFLDADAERALQEPTTPPDLTWGSGSPHASGSCCDGWPRDAPTGRLPANSSCRTIRWTVTVPISCASWECGTPRVSPALPRGEGFCPQNELGAADTLCGGLWL